MVFRVVVLLCLLCGMAWADGRVVLPTTVTPVAYRIGIVPDAAALTFTGTAEIDVRVNRATRVIVLNAVSLAFTRVALSGESGAPSVAFDAKTETATLTFGRPIAPGMRTLSIAYSGTINRNAAGLFALDYQTPDGTAKRALYTQFENADFRRFAPSWDEPALKATFEMSVAVPDGMVAVSNMPIRSSEGGTVRFLPSPRMSSYLVSLNVGDFERIAQTVDGVDVGVVVRRGETAKAAYALETAVKVLHYYNDYFGLAYPLPKLDLIAAPGNSQVFTAMENWGAILFFDSSLLLDPRLARQSSRQRVFGTVAHEMAHQWFGNLVTMAWWDDLWLNEGFANWMSAKVTGHFNPGWDMSTQELATKADAYADDAQAGTHPVVTPIVDVLQAASAFDSITYEKGEAVVTMLEAYVGADAWRDGVRRYMAKYKYGNTVSDDLWREMDAGVRRPVTAIAHDFTLQAGVPLLRVEPAGVGLRLSQGRFGLDAASRASRRWRMPVAVGPREAIVLNGAPVVVPGQAAAVNAGQAGYFRVAYLGAAFTQVSEAYPRLPVVDQVGILGDAFALGRAGLVPAGEALDLSRRLPAEADPLVWIRVIAVLRSVNSIFRGDPRQAAVEDYGRRVLQPLHARLGWDAIPGESDNAAVLREDVLSAMGTFRDPAVAAEARERFQRFLADHDALKAPVRLATLGIVAVSASSEEWEQLHELARGTRDAAEKSLFYRLLSRARDPALATRALELSVSGEPPATLGPSMLRGVSGLHPALAFEFFTAHRDVYLKVVEADARYRFPAGLVSGVNDPALLDRFEAYAKTEIPVTARGDAIRALAAGRNVVALRATWMPAVTQWIAAHPG